MNKKNILIVTPVSPLDHDNGGTMAMKSHILMLKDEFNVHVLYAKYLTDEIEEKFKDELKGVTFIPFESPPKRLSKIQWIRRRISNFFHAKTSALVSSKEIIDDYLSAKFSQLFNAKTKSLIELLVHTIEQFNISAVEIHFIQWADLVYAIPQHVKTVFVHHELRSLRLRTQLQTLSENEKHRNKNFITYITQYIDNQELALLNAFDRVILLSKYDRSFLINALKAKRDFDVIYPPIYHEINSQPLENNFKSPKLWFVGGAGHPPNRDGIFWLMRMITESPEDFKDFLPVSVTGEWDERWTKKLKDEFGDLVSVDGYVDDFDKHSRNKILICSVRIGSGIRMKLLKAMSIKVPILTTQEGAMGIDFEDGKDALFFNDRESLILKLNDINEEFLHKISGNAYSKFKDLYSYEKQRENKIVLYKREFAC